MASPYEIVLGPALADLHPRLRAYSGAIPPGSVGCGTGTFDRVGTPRRWLWPALALLGRAGIAFPAWERGVPFTVENRPIIDARGDTAVAAIRTFHLARGERRMVDAITAVRSSGSGDAALADHLGRARRLTAPLRATVHDGALHLVSTGLSVRIGSRHVGILPALAPRVHLIERFDAEVGRQHVSIVLRMPEIGRIYEYSGHFDYALVADASASATGTSTTGGTP